jgi:ACS family hexuronate transporter-like MFS transporter
LSRLHWAGITNGTRVSRLLNYFRSHQRWLIVALLFLVALVNNLDRQSLSVLAPTLQHELGFGPVEYSYVVSAFLAAYTLGYLFAGQVLDRIGVKLGLALALGFWSFAGLLHATVNGWLMLAVFRFLLGLGESFNSPAGVKAISEWIPPRERGLSMAVFSNGNVIGAVLAPPLVAFLALRLGWRWAFVMTGLVGLVLVVIWWRCYDSPEKSARLTAGEREYLTASLASTEAAGPKLSMWELLLNPLCLGFFLARFLTDSWSYFLSFWLPEYLTHSRGFTLATIGLVGWLPYLAGDIGGPGGGAMSDWLVRRGWRPARARQALMLFAACLMPLALVAVRTNFLWVAVALIGLLFAAQTCWMANQLSLISESVSRQNVATLLSLSALGGSIGGIVSNLLVGRAVGSVGYVPVFTVFGVLHLLAFGVLIVCQRWAHLRTRRMGAA